MKQVWGKPIRGAPIELNGSVFLHIIDIRVWTAGSCAQPLNPSMPFNILPWESSKLIECKMAVKGLCGARLEQCMREVHHRNLPLDRGGIVRGASTGGHSEYGSNYPGDDPRARDWRDENRIYDGRGSGSKYSSNLDQYRGQIWNALIDFLKLVDSMIPRALILEWEGATQKWLEPPGN